MNYVPYLRKAKQLIQDGWIQYHEAKTKAGRITDATAENAARFCILGAIDRVRSFATQDENGILISKFDMYTTLKIKLKKELPQQFKFEPLHVFNDASTTTKADVLALFDRTIAAEEKI